MLLVIIDVGLYALVGVSVGCVESSGVGSSVFISMIALTEMGCEDRRWMELAQDVCALAACDRSCLNIRVQLLRGLFTRACWQ